jgi:essential nuclear protein 1
VYHRLYFVCLGRRIQLILIIHVWFLGICSYIENDQGYVNVRDGALGLSPEDEAIVAAMNRNSGGVEERKTLADIIMEKIAEKEAKESGQVLEEEEEGLPPLPPKVVDVYTDIGKILSRYTSGKLPKAFKVIPSLSNWEQVLYLTRPDQWTPQAMYAATRIFASNLNPKMAQRFYYLVLLDACRADIYENKKLNYHYYMSLKKAVYKPAAFFKGILLPLCKSDCTLREAAIVASVLQRVSIPVHHSAVAIHKLAQMTEYNGAASIFIRTLLNKKYALPVPVISSLVRHFASFLNDDRDLPVLWHQALLVFCQRYKNEVQDQARESLRLVMKKHFHSKITPEIRRELYGAAAWKDERSSRSAGTTKDVNMAQ